MGVQGRMNPAKVEPCRWYSEIGAGVCDNCGGKQSEHDGMLMLKHGSTPFGKAEWEGLTWAEWDVHVETSKQVREARKRIASLNDDETILLGRMLR